MESRRPSKADYGNHSREHQRRSTKPPHQANKHTSNKSKSQHRLQDNLASLPALSGDDDYVRQWLVQTNQESKAAVRESTVSVVNSDNIRPPKYRLRTFLATAEDLEGAQAWSGKRRRRNSSSDSSFLEPAIQSKSAEQKINSAELHPKTAQHPQKKGKPEPSDADFSTLPILHQETFEKRPRHKTKEDLYDSKKKKRKHDKDDEGKPKAKRTKRGDGKKAAKRAGEDLMSNFTSKSVSQNRLTIRPSQGLGLFKNGRASSPAKRRGLPDLAFSEMEFLQRAAYASAKPDDKIMSRSREKETRRAQRAHDEMSTFFRRVRTPLNDAIPNVRHKRSSYEEMLKAGQSSQHPRSRSFDFSEKFFSGPRQLAPSQSVSTPCGIPTFKNRSGDDLETNSNCRYFGKEATYISWSETQLSPTAKSKRLRNDHGQNSPIPDSVRLSIESTGIFRDTGINLTLEKSRSRNNIHPSSLRSKNSPTVSQVATEDLRPRSPARRGSETLSAATLEKYTKGSASRNRSQSPRKLLGNRQDERRGLDPKAVERQVYSPLVRNSGKGTCQVNIEHYDRKLGWHQQRSSRSPQKTESRFQEHITEVPESRSTPIDRKHLAQKARIKRPSTTLPKAHDRQAKEDLPMEVIRNIQNSTSKHPEGVAEDQHISERHDATLTADIQIDQEHETGFPTDNSPVQRATPAPVDERNLNMNLSEDKPVHIPPKMGQSSEAPHMGHDTGTQSPKGMISEPFKIETDNLGRPELQSWIGRSHGYTAPRSRLSPVMEVVPLYAHQIHQALDEFPEISQDVYTEHTEQPHFENEITYDPSLSPSWEGIREEGFIRQVEGDYDSHQLQLGDELEAYTDGVTGEAWQLPEPIGTGEMKGYGSNQNVEQSIAYPYEAQDEFRGPGLVPSYGYEHGYQQHDNQGDDYAQRFWRPNRQY